MRAVCAALAAGLAALSVVACGTATAADPQQHHPRSVRAAQPCYWHNPDGHVYVQFVPGPHVPRNAFCGQAQPYLAWPGDGGKIWPGASSLPKRKYVAACSVTGPYGNWTVLSEAQQDPQAQTACSFVQTSRMP
jgi:hypothetical protein